MIGMSPSMMSSFWNPQAKNKQLEFNGQPYMPTDTTMGGGIFRPMTMPPGGGEINVQAPGLTPPMGNEAQMPPISPSRNLLTKHMTLPSGETSAELPSSGPGRSIMRPAIPRSGSRFGMPKRSSPMLGGMAGGVKRSIF